MKKDSRDSHQTPRSPDAPQYWEEFEIPYRATSTSFPVLNGNPQNPSQIGKAKRHPRSWDMNCLEQVCGICTMVINGTRSGQSCSALVDNLDQPIKLEPMSKFPNVRDLGPSIARQMFDSSQACACVGRA